MAWSFEVYPDSGGNHRWRLKSSNGQKVATSGESFYSEGNAKRAAEGFKASASGYSYEVYADSGGNYRWRVTASNGQKVAASGESFSSQSAARTSADNVKANAGSATIT